MNEHKGVFACVLIAGLILTAAVVGFGQGESRPLEPSCQVSLQFVVGTNDGGKGDLPANLASIARQLKNEFGFSNYRIAGTLFGRVGNNGTYEYKSISNIFGQESAGGTPTFLEWTITELRRAQSEKGPGFEGSTFRFGARVPVMLPRSEEGRTGMAINYESLGVNARRFGLAENTPTLIGTISLPGTPGTIFLVVTARAAD